MREGELWFTVPQSDIEMQTFRTGGKGGQNQNKRDTGVRLIHRPSGATSESREHRTQIQNRKAALQRLIKTAKWRVWLAQECDRLRGLPSVEELVERQMAPENLRVDVHDSRGRWVPHPVEG